MDNNKRQLIKAKIESELLNLSEKIKELKDLTKPISPENAIGRVSRMDAINNKSVNDAALATSEQKLIKLQIALSKIESPEYGTCINCGKEIQEGRLLFMPESAYCMACASRN